MPKTCQSNGQGPPASTPSRTVFATVGKWEDPWQSRFDLSKLRGKAASLEYWAALVRSRSAVYGIPSEEEVAGLLPIDRTLALRLVKPLELPPILEARLLDDSILLGRWYAAPAARLALSAGHESELARFKRAKQKARRLWAELVQDQMSFETLFQTVDDSGLGKSDIDLPAVIWHLERFMGAADRTLKVLRPPSGGRKADIRRNRAIRLATEAVEEATGEFVKVSRRNGQFDNVAGRYVRDVLKLLGWPDEDVLVGAFERLRREGRVNQPGAV